jgi:hypothetical protein
MTRDVTAIRYPVAANAEQALARPLGRAGREREARETAGEAVEFAVELAGPAFATRAAALDAYQGMVEDERSGCGPEPEARFCRLVELAAEAGQGAPRPVKPSYRDGRRWPTPAAAPRTVWRLSVSYWRVGSAERPLEVPQARKARRAGQPVDPETLRAMARQPLRPVEPQRPLDIGLFETRLPEAPHIVVPDE